MQQQEIHRVGIVYNPVCWKGKASDLFDRIILPKLNDHFIVKKQIPLHSMKTQCRDDGVRCAFELIVNHQCDLIIGVGGDGSLGSVLNGLILGCLHLNPNALNESKQQGRPLPVQLALIPSGTGNDFMRTLLETSGQYYVDVVSGFGTSKFEESVGKIVDMILSDHGSMSVPIDVGRVDYTPMAAEEAAAGGQEIVINNNNGNEVGDQVSVGKVVVPDSGFNVGEQMKTRFFLNASTLGIGPEILKSVNNPNSCIPKSLSYVIQPILKEFTYKNPFLQLKMQPDNKSIENHIQLVIVSNGRYVNNGFRMNPMASVTNNHLNLCIVGDVGVRDLYLFYRLKSGSHINHSKITMVEEIESLTVGTRENQSVHVECDGDVIGKLPAHYTVLPSVVNVIVPKSFKKFEDEI